MGKHLQSGEKAKGCHTRLGPGVLLIRATMAPQVKFRLTIGNSPMADRSKKRIIKYRSYFQKENCNVILLIQTEYLIEEVYNLAF